MLGYGSPFMTVNKEKMKTLTFYLVQIKPNFEMKSQNIGIKSRNSDTKSQISRKLNNVKAKFIRKKRQTNKRKVRNI